MSIFLSGNANINNIFIVTILLFYIMCVKESSTTQKDNTRPRVVTRYTILRNYISILNSLPANFCVHVNISTINAPLIITPCPSYISVSGYGHTNSRPIIILPIYWGEFLYLLLCYTFQSEKNIYRLTVNTHVTIMKGFNNFCVSIYIHIISKPTTTFFIRGNNLILLLPYPVIPT